MTPLMFTSKQMIAVFRSLFPSLPEETETLHLHMDAKKQHHRAYITWTASMGEKRTGQLDLDVSAENTIIGTLREIGVIFPLIIRELDFRVDGHDPILVHCNFYLATTQQPLASNLHEDDTNVLD